MMRRHCFCFILLMSFIFLPELGFASITRLLLATVTAYTSSSRAITASGTPAFEGVVACPRKYPLGTRFEIEGKVYVCRDRLSRRYDNRFDIWKPTSIAARLFGKRKLAIIQVKHTPTLIAQWIHTRPVRF